eukprot:TRINITY_DN12017_c0_g1_i1.p1 TRINITY_DN12017_c0_g1~~TRINITY_DN12017_c0_g1_i1.p1  ORF type:complete len:169 (-),score=25.67 TRINITY_DN12017_c0_g1_i1:20-526(-)
MKYRYKGLRRRSRCILFAFLVSSPLLRAMGFPVGCSELLLIPSFVFKVACFLGFIRRAFHGAFSGLGLTAAVAEEEWRHEDYCYDLSAPCESQCILGLENVLPALKFEAHQEVECAVCLCQVKMGQEIRVSKKCGHMFHRACLDPWLLLHPQPTCPLCRASLFAGSSG